MRREVFADEVIAQRINKNLVPVMIYEGDPGADALFTKYNIGGTPITLLTDAKG